MIESKNVPIDSIHPNSWNPNVMKGSVYEFLKRSIKDLGFVQPVLVTRDGTIIDGEHRWKAAKEVGQKELNQWFFKITAYADELLEDLSKLQWSEQLKSLQTNWITNRKTNRRSFAFSKPCALLPLGGHFENGGTIFTSNFLPQLG